MADAGEFVGDIKFCTELFELLIVELLIIVGNNIVWQSESVYIEFLDEVFHFAFNNLY